MVPFLALTRTPSIAPSSAELTWPFSATAFWAEAVSRGRNDVTKNRRTKRSAAAKRMVAFSHYLTRQVAASLFLIGGKPKPATLALQGTEWPCAYACC